MTVPKISSQDLPSIPCNLCGSKEVSILATLSRRGEPLRSVICSKCGLVWSDPLPSNLHNFYENDYRVSYKGNYSPKLKHILRAGNVALSRHRQIERLLATPLTVLDVGSGGGEFSYLLETLGHHVTGIEPNKGYAEYSIREYGLTVQVGFVQDIIIPQQSFDLITIWHVLEHTEDPFAVLTKLHSLLKPQGIVVVEVPNIEAKCQSPKSTFHEAHIFHFNIASLKRLAEKVGFIEINHLISADGGNITLFLQKTIKEVNGLDEFTILGNAEKISKIVTNHTPLKHYLTTYPYIRLFSRLRQYCFEERNIKNFNGGKQLLDHQYAHLHNQGINPSANREEEQ